MSSDLGIADYQFYWGPAGGGGLTFGDGTNVDAMGVEGLTSQNAMIKDRQHHQEFGDIPGIALATARAITFVLDVRRGNLTDVQWRDLIDDVESAFTINKLTQEELHWQLPGEEERFLRARTQRRSRVIDPDSELGISRIAVQLRAADPRFYVAAPNTDNGNTGSFVVTNNGKHRAYPIITFDRGVTSPATCGITNNTTGQVISVTGLSGTTDLVMDMDALVRGETGLVVFRGTTNDYGNWQQTRHPFYLEPGANNIDLDAGDDVSFQWWDTFV